MGDRNTGDLKALAGREWDVCIDNPTTLPFWVRDAGQVLRGKVKQYVFISTLSAYASDKDPGQDESAPLAVYKGKDAMKETQETLRADIEGLYGPLKALSEKEAQTQFPGMTTIVRPGLIVGPGDESDRFTYWPVRLDRGGDVLAPGDGSDPVQFVDARDLAEWTIRLAEARTFGVFNAMGPAFDLTMADALAGIRAATTTGAQAALGARRLPRAAEGDPLGRHADLGPGDGRHRGLRPPQEREGGRRRPHVPPARADRPRHAGLVEDAARRPPGEAPRGHRPRERAAGPRGVEGQEGLAGVPDAIAQVPETGVVLDGVRLGTAYRRWETPSRSRARCCSGVGVVIISMA